MAERPSLKNLWAQRIAGIEFDENIIFRPVTHEDVIYLRKKYPFLQIINTAADFSEEVIPEFITCEETGWVIHDYGDAMSSSTGEELFDGWDDKALLVDLTGEKEEGEEGGEAGGLLYTGKGTIIKQMINTTFAMVDLAIQKNWAGIDVIDGTELMKWATWAAAVEKDVKVFGFEPDEEDEKRRRRISTKIFAEQPAVLQPE